MASPKVKANLLNDQFISVFSKETSNVSDIRVPGKPYARMNQIQFTSVEINKLLKKLQSQKAASPNSIPTHLLKITADEVLSVLRLILQASMHQGLVPRDW